MGEATLVEWLMGQAPLVIVLGVVIWWLVRRYEESLKKIEEVNTEKTSLARDVVKITVLWEQKYNLDTQNDQEIRQILLEIREAVSKK